MSIIVICYLDQFWAGIHERSQLGIEQAGVGTILGPTTIIETERWFHVEIWYAPP